MWLLMGWAGDVVDGMWLARGWVGDVAGEVGGRVGRGCC